MLIKATLGKEIVATVTNKVGAMADISRIVAEQGINIEAVAGYAKEDRKSADIMLVTSDNGRAMEALKKSGYTSMQEREIIIAELENARGALKDISIKMAQQNIDLKYIYGTTCPSNCPARLVISTNNNAKAFSLLKE